MHAAVYGSPQLEGRQIGKYVIHYAAGGQTAELPIVYGQQVLDWHCLTGESWTPPELELVWKGTNSLSVQNRSFIRLFKTTWENPNPELEIGTLELMPEVAIASGAGPFVVAITADPPGTPPPIITLAKSPNRGLLPQIPPRDPKAGSQLIDLSAYYNAGLFQDMLRHKENNLARLPNGLQVFGDVEFDVRGLIRLAIAGQQVNRSPTGPWDDDHGYPDRLEGIPINQKAHQLNFLQACMGLAAPESTRIGSYVVHLANGEQIETPIIYGQHTAHWAVALPKAGMVWTGVGPVPDLGIIPKHLFKQTWTNPSPGVEIRSLDFVSAMTPTTAPFLVAITAE